MNWWISNEWEFLISLRGYLLHLRKMEPFDSGMGRMQSLKNCCLDVVSSRFDRMLDAHNDGKFSPKNYEFLQRTSTEALLDRMKGRKNLSEKHVDFFINPFVKELNLDAFSPMQIPNIIEKLKKSKQIKSFHLTRFVYPKQILLQLVNLLPQLNTLCLDKTRCSNQVLRSIAEKCPLLKTLDVRECLDIGDEGIRGLCRQDESGNYMKNSVLEELDIWSTDVSIHGISFAIQYFPNLTKLNHYLLCTAIYKTHILPHLDSPGDSAIAVKTFKLKELPIHPVNELNVEILRMYSILCPDVTVLRISGFETQDEIDVCARFNHLMEISVFAAKNTTFLSLTSLIRLQGERLTRLEIGGASISLKVLSECCPELQSLYIHHCELEDLSDLIYGPAVPLNTLEVLTLDDVIFPLIDDSVQMIMLACPNLEQLILLYVISIADEFVNELACFSFLPRLRSIEMIYSTIKVSAIAKLIKTIPNLERIVIDQCQLSNIEYHNLLLLGKQNSRVQFIIKNTTHTPCYYNSRCPQDSEDNEIWGYGFDYEDEFESDLFFNS